MLDHLTVLELAGVLAGPSVGQFLAELGATVLKVENTLTRGDVTRRWKLPAEPAGADVSSYFACCNWGKKSVALNLQTEAGRDLLHALVRQSDIVLASYRPGDAERLGADHATLRAINPRLVYAHVTGYGPDDPRPGYDAVVQAESGFMDLNGPSEGPPLKMPVALVDVLAAHQLKEALLLALLQRARTDEGAYVSVSLLQAAVGTLANQATAWLMAGVLPRRTGSDHPSIAPYGTVFRTAGDEAVVLAVGTDRQFEALCRVLGLPLAEDPRFRTNQARVTHRAALHALLQPALAVWPRAELLAALAQHGVPAGAVHDVRTAFAHPAAAALVLRDAARADAAGLRQATFTLGDAPPARPLPPPPHYGEHTEDVLRRLGLLPEAIADLAGQGVVYVARR